MSSARLALIVANARYQDPALRDLRAPAHDADALASVLRDPEIGGFEVRTVIDQPSHAIMEAIEDFFADRGLDDLLLVHFSCHGIKDASGDLYFAATNTRPGRLTATAVAADVVNRLMHRSLSRRIVLLLDCCFSGAYNRNLIPRAGTAVTVGDHLAGGHGRAVISASGSLEYAHEGDGDGPAPSVFTDALVRGLRTGEADRDQDGLVTLGELYRYIFDSVRAVTPHQTPGLTAVGIQNELVIARRASPVTDPAPLPVELATALTSTLPSVRLAIVSELANLRRSRHAGLVLAAEEALRRLVDDDSRTVARAAHQALTDDQTATATTPRPVQTGEARPQDDVGSHPRTTPDPAVTRPQPGSPVTTAQPSEALVPAPEPAAPAKASHNPVQQMPREEPHPAGGDATSASSTAARRRTEGGIAETGYRRQHPPEDYRQQPSEAPWRFYVGGTPAPADAPPYVLLTGNVDQVVTLDQSNGQLQWRREFPVLHGSAPTISGASALVAGGDSRLWSLDVTTGETHWQADLQAVPTAAPTVAGTTVVVPTRDGCVTTLDFHSGNQLWRKELSQPVHGPIATDGRALYFGGHDCNVRAWSVDGAELWAFRTRKWFDAPPAIHGDSLFIGGYDCRLYRLDRATGELDWHRPAGARIKGTPTVCGDLVVFGAYDGVVYALDKKSGASRWTYEVGSAIKASPVVRGTVVYVGARDGLLHAIGARDGRSLWRYETGGAVNSTPVSTGSLLVVGSDDGYLYALDGDSGDGPAS